MGQALADALRLAVDPPSGVNVEALHDLVRDDQTPAWNISTTAAHLGVSPHTLRYYGRNGLLTVGRDRSGHRSYDAPAVRRLVGIRPPLHHRHGTPGELDGWLHYDNHHRPTRHAGTSRSSHD